MTDVVTTSIEIQSLQGPTIEVALSPVGASATVIQQYLTAALAAQEASEDARDLSQGYSVVAAQEANLSFQYANTSSQYADVSSQYADVSTQQANLSSQYANTSSQYADVSTQQANLSFQYANTSSQYAQDSLSAKQDVEEYANQLGSVEDITANGDIILLANSDTYQFIDPDGSDRSVTLPTLTQDDEGRGFAIHNTASAGPYVLSVYDSVSTQIGPAIPYGYTLAVIWTGTAWRAL